MEFEQDLRELSDHWSQIREKVNVSELIEAKKKLAYDIQLLISQFGWENGVSVRSVDYKVDPDRLFKCDVAGVDVELDI